MVVFQYTDQPRPPHIRTEVKHGSYNVNEFLLCYFELPLHLLFTLSSQGLAICDTLYRLLDTKGGSYLNYV